VVQIFVEVQIPNLSVAGFGLKIIFLKEKTYVASVIKKTAK